MRRTCDLMTSMKMQAATIGSTSWYATKSNCAKLASDLEELLNGLESEEGVSTVVIFNILDKAYFQARGEDGSYIPHRQLEGKYHVYGDLVTIPNEQVKYLFKMMVPIFKAADGVHQLLVTPIPRYLYLGCCDEADHAPNRADEGFVDSILEALDKTKRTLQSLAFKHKLKVMKILNPAKFLAVEHLWESDPVHPTAKGYRLLVDYLVKFANDSCTNNSHTEANTTMQPAEKKRRPDEQLAGPSRRQFWITGPGANSQDWTSCRGLSGPRGRGRGWRGKRRNF
jgi:hypothetical protein